MVRICIQMRRTPFKLLEFAFECYESRSNSSNLNPNGSNPFSKVRTCIRIPFEWSEFVFESFEVGLNGLNLNGLKSFRMVRIYIQIFRGWFEWFEFEFECFESLSNG